MRRALSVCVLATLLIAATGSSASATEPRIPRVEIIGLDGTWTGPEGETEHVVAIHARDPDGYITEVQVEFEQGSIVFAHTYCFIFAKGETAHMRIGNAFPGPGTYEVRARAISKRDCGARASQTSRWDVEQVVIPA